MVSQGHHTPFMVSLGHHTPSLVSLGHHLPPKYFSIFMLSEWHHIFYGECCFTCHIYFKMKREVLVGAPVLRLPAVSTAYWTQPQLPQHGDGSAGCAGCWLRDLSGPHATLHWPTHLHLHRFWQRVTGEAEVRQHAFYSQGKRRGCMTMDKYCVVQVTHPKAIEKV